LRVQNHQRAMDAVTKRSGEHEQRSADETAELRARLARHQQRTAQDDEKVIDLDALTDLSENSCPNPNVRRSAPNMAQGPDSPE
jgi:hypothetical protein